MGNLVIILYSMLVVLGLLLSTSIFFLYKKLQVPFRNTPRTKWTVLCESLKWFIFGMPKTPDYQVVDTYDQLGDLPYNCYHFKTGKEFKHNWMNVHAFFKYRMIVPLLNLFDIFFDHKKLTSIPDKESNYILLALQEAQRQGERDWYKFFLYPGESETLTSEQITERMNTCEPILRMRSIFEWTIAVPATDNSYREYLNCMMFRFYNILKNDHYDGKNKKITHLLYNNKHTNDVRYFTLFHDIKNQRDIVHQHPDTEYTKKHVSPQKK